MIRFVALLIATVLVAADGAPIAAQAPGAEAPPRQLVEALRAIYRLRQYTVFDWIGGRYDRGTLTLEGFAARPALKERAEEVAKRSAGVDEVVNDIEVLPALQSDDQLRLRMYVAIYGHPALERYLPGGPSRMAVRELESASFFGLESSSQFTGAHPIHIVVSAASVQLFGSVSSAGDRQIAEAQLRGLPGVLNVINRIQVRGGR
ncbi:MAG: BON domain-containing protein [Acidobacteriota bacterium]